MSAAFSKTGQRKTIFSAPANTSETSAHTVPSGGVGEVLQGINIAVGTAANISVRVNDGSTDWYLLDTYSQAANTTETYTFGEVFLEPGWIVKVTTSTANEAVFAITVEQVFQG